MANRQRLLHIFCWKPLTYFLCGGGGVTARLCGRESARGVAIDRLEGPTELYLFPTRERDVALW